MKIETKDPKRALIQKIHNAIRWDYIKSELLVIGLEVIFVFLLLQFITIFIPILQNDFTNTALRINFTLSTIISLFYSAFRILHKLHKFDISKIQPKLGELDEIYAATIDLSDTDSLPAQSLQNEFIQTAKKVSTFPLFNYKRLLKRMGYVVLILCMLIATPFLGEIKTIDTSWVSDLIPKDTLTEFFTEPDNVTLLSDEGIYGNQTYLIDGESTLDITLDLSTGGGDYANPLAWQNNLKSSGSAATTRIEAQIDSPAIEKLPEEFELAKAYNLKIKQLQ